MSELRSIDPRALKPNPNNPRKTPAPPAMEEQLIASIKAIGIIQPPVVREIEGALVVKAGDRRVKAAVAAGLSVIDVLVREADDTLVPMESLSENLIRASMNSVDIWRAVEGLESQGWNEQAIADALALPVRTVKRLKLLAHLHPPMLDLMARGSMPSEEQLRTIAAATLEEQAQVWKKFKPRKGEAACWPEIARALSKRRIPFSAAQFDEDLARAYGVVWEDDLFVPAGQDGRYTTNVEGFFGAQQEWLSNHLPPRGVLLTQDEYGCPVLPKKAERVYGKPGKADVIGCYLDPHSGDVKQVAYRMPPEKSATKAGEKGEAAAPEAPQPKARPDVNQRGNAMIGDFRTDALHQALTEREIPDQTLVALLVLALAAKNVSVQSGAALGAWDREAIRDTLIEGGVLTADPDLIRAAGRAMLKAVLSCRDNLSNSGIDARIAGEAIGASEFLPTMATEEFLSCLSRQALEHAAAAHGVCVEVRVRDTRARMVERFTGTTYHYPSALFRLTQDELANNSTRPGRHINDGAGLCDGEPGGNQEDGTSDEVGETVHTADAGQEASEGRGDPTVADAAN